MKTDWNHDQKTSYIKIYHFKNKQALRTTLELYLLFLNDVDVNRSSKFDNFILPFLQWGMHKLNEQKQKQIIRGHQEQIIIRLH